MIAQVSHAECFRGLRAVTARSLGNGRGASKRQDGERLSPEEDSYRPGCGVKASPSKKPHAYRHAAEPTPTTPTRT